LKIWNIFKKKKKPITKFEIKLHMHFKIKIIGINFGLIFWW